VFDVNIYIYIMWHSRQN